MTRETALDAVFTAFYAIIVSGNLTFIIGWLISKAVRPGFAWWVMPLVILGFFLTFVLGAGITLYALGQFNLGWLWPIRAIAVITSVATAIASYCWGARRSFTTR